MVAPTQPTMFSLSLQMDARFHITPNQVLFGVSALLIIGGLIYLASREGGANGIRRVDGVLTILDDRKAAD